MTRCNAAEYLDTEERQAAYITAALESGDAIFVRDDTIARASGIRQGAKTSREPEQP